MTRNQLISWLSAQRDNALRNAFHAWNAQDTVEGKTADYYEGLAQGYLLAGRELRSMSESLSSEMSA